MKAAMATATRLGLLALALLLAAGSAATNNNVPQGGAPAGDSGPPPARPMDPVMAVGVYKTNFGPVKIELDEYGSGLSNGVHGVWVYDREGLEVLGYFYGDMDGNILRFSWEERPSPAPLTGQGYLVFEQDGRSFYGKWWTQARDRVGDWSGEKYLGGDAPDGAVPDPNDQRPPEPAPTTFTRR